MAEYGLWELSQHLIAAPQAAINTALLLPASRKKEGSIVQGMLPSQIMQCDIRKGVGLSVYISLQRAHLRAFKASVFQSCLQTL